MPQLQEFARRDEGYQQFCRQFNMVASDPAAQDEYHLWFLAKMKEEGIREYADRQSRERGREQGRDEGIVIGQEMQREKSEKEKLSDRKNLIMKMTLKGIDDNTIADLLNLQVEDLTKYRGN